MVENGWVEEVPSDKVIKEGLSQEVTFQLRPTR